MELPAALLQHLRAVVASAEANHARLFEALLANHGEALGLGPDESPGSALVERLNGAIEAEIARRIEEMERWPEVTDNDRLGRAFEDLEGQGLVAFGPAGFTLQEAQSVAVLRCLALEERGWTPTGFCTFHRQDLWMALEGGGLTLAFGSFDDDASDAAARVGAIVVGALRRAGLEPEWDGSGNTRIALPTFVWRARLRVATEAEIEDFLESWELELRACRDPWSSPEHLFGELAERASEWFADAVDYGPRLFARLRAHTEQFVATEQEREASWTEATMNDRLAAALEDLRGRGVLVQAGTGTTLQDAWAYVGIAAGASSEGYFGAVLYSDEDVIDAVEGRPLHLAFGAFDHDPRTRDEHSRALAREIVAALSAHGVPSRWSGAVHERVVVLPFTWRLRRTTTAPPHERIPPTPAPSWWNRLFRAKPVAPPAAEPAVFTSLRRRFVEGGHAVLVRAPLSTAGFDLRRSRSLRAAFEAQGGGLRAHACHLGLPYAFVPVDHYTMFAAMPAIENLTEEAVRLRERGVRTQEA